MVRRHLQVLLASWLMMTLAGSPVLAKERCAMTCKQEVVTCKKTRCAGLPRKARRACVEDCQGRAGCPSAIRTLAYVVTECREDSHGTAGRQALMVRQGDCEPVAVMSLGSNQPAPDPYRLCEEFGRTRGGYRFVLAGSFTRLGVSPDGSVVVFEVTDDFFALPTFSVPPLEEGIYVVRADGQGLHRVGDASRTPSGRLVTTPPRNLFYNTFDIFYHFSPDGRTVVFTDKGPGPSGVETVQVVTLDLATGRRTQVTRLPSDPGPTFDRFIPVTQQPRFVDHERIVFFTYTNADGQHPTGGYFTVRTDGTDLRPVSTPVAPPDGYVVETFDIAGTGTNVLGIQVPGTAVNGGFAITEMFLLDGKRLLQLTKFGRWDTGGYGKFLDRRGRRAYFVASANPLRTNPSENCQLFSVGLFGTGFRQLTHFREADRSDRGCGNGPPPGCAVGPPVFQDPVTSTIVFYSNCDPFGTSPYGAQVFAMRPDGTGLRQLTATRGLVVEAGGALSVELPGPVAYSAFQGGR